MLLVFTLMKSCSFPLITITLYLYRRPTALLDRGRDSDDEILHNRDYDIPVLGSHLSQVCVKICLLFDNVPLYYFGNHNAILAIAGQWSY